ncbi:MAG TPA: DUF5916 domain-containing protein [Gemmatimonadales bacterium]|jgi:hypothetical protein|nr:DUF5916 domain-containing protein [Gemmatimonadales bacterium]
MTRLVLRRCAIAAALSFCAAEASAQGPDGARPALRVGAVAQHGITLDGVLSEPLWTTVDSISNLITVEPEEGKVPTGRTVVRVLVTATDIIMGVRCYDPEPRAIVSFTKARDIELDEEDHIVIILDTFQDGRSGYVFAVNPDGARFDGLISAEGEDVNSNWDTAWEARTARDDQGWSIEIRIPIKSISYKQGLTSWGYNVERNIQRLQEISRWSGISLDIEIYQTSRAGLLTDLPRFSQGRGLTIRPSMIGNLNREEPAAPSEFTGDLSVDVTQRVGTNLTASLTYNTDFAETESDARQTNLTRFDILFPEKRAFFLEGSDIFEFGLGLDDANLLPLFTRRIGLLNPEEGDAEKIPILLGGKLNGRIGNTNLGTLVVRTESLDSVPGTTMGVVRVKQNVFEESSVGVIATAGDPLGQTGSWLAGADFTYRTSRFLGDKRLLVGVWGLRNDRDGLTGNKNAYGFKVDYPADLFNFALTSVTIGDAVQPSLGFAPRTDVRVWDVGIDYDPRPSWGLVRQMYHGASLVLFTDLGNEWETYEGTIKPFDWLLESGDRLGFELQPQGDRPPEDFAVFETEADTVTIPAGSYQWTRYAVTGTLAEKRRVSGQFTYAFGTFYGGHLQTIEGTLTLKPSPLFSVELATERNHGDLPGGQFTQSLYGGRLEVKPSADFQVSSFLQYDNESRSFGTNTRLRWTFHTLGDLFVVYNHNLLRSLGTRERFGFESNQFLVKLVYGVRM